MPTGLSNADISAAAGVIGRLLVGDVAFSSTALAECLQGLGWSSVSHAGEAATPNPWKWEKAGQLSFIVSEGSEVFVEFIFGSIAPGGYGFESAINDEYEAVVATVRPAMRNLIAYLGASGAYLNSTGSCPDDAVDFIDQECWEMVNFHLSMGVAHSDETVPVLFMARLRRGVN